MNAPLDIVLADLRDRFAALYGPRLDRIVLVGSRARGDAGPGSDVDVMIVLKDKPERRIERDRTMTVAADLSWRYDTVIMPILTDSSTCARSGLPLFRNAQREGVAL